MAAAFSGNNFYTNSVPQLNNGLASFTLSLWIKRTGFRSVGYYFLTKSAPGNYSCELYFQNDTADSTIGWDGNFSGSNSPATQNSTVVVSGRWYHLVIVGTPTSKAYFLNGKPDGAFSTDGGMFPNSSLLYVGARRIDNQGAIVQLSGVQLFDIAFSAQEVAALYKKELR
jgi:hypothetical protein